jgi:hypothetical protein
MTYLKVPIEDMNLLKRVIANLIEASNLNEKVFFAKAIMVDCSNTFTEQLVCSQSYYSIMNRVYISIIESRRLAKCSADLVDKTYEEITQ